jgi:cytochrome c oxidase cbb3-type subunit 4
MEKITPYLSAFSTLIGIIFFVGIVWWAWSPQRQPENEASAELPFDLPDEFSKDKS